MHFNVLRSHWDEFDVIWLGDCRLKGQIISFGLGYFHKRLTQKEQILLSNDGQVFEVELTPNLINLEERIIVLDGQLKVNGD